MAETSVAGELYDRLVVDAVAERERHREVMRGYSQTLALDILESDRQPSISEALAAILGFAGNRETSEAFKATLGKVERASLGRLAIFDKDDNLESVGVLSEKALGLRLEYAYSAQNISGLRLDANASFAWAVKRYGFSNKFADYSPLSHRVGHISVDHGGIYSELKSVEMLQGVAHSFSLLKRDDTGGRVVMGAFYDELTKRAEPVQAASASA